MTQNIFSLDGCMKCSYCNIVCPLLKVRPDYPGPKRLGADIERFRREGFVGDSDWLDYCLGCGQCSLACPNQVEIAENIAAARRRRKKAGIKKVRDYFLERPDLLGKIATMTAPASNLALQLASPFLSLGKISKKRQLPAYKTSWQQYMASSKSCTGMGQVVFFPGCSIRYNNPEIGEAAIQIMEKFGLQVALLDCGCCGLPADTDEAETLAAASNNLQVLASWVERGYSVVTACTSCGYSFKARYAGMFSKSDPCWTIAAQVAANTYDLGEYLTELYEKGRLKLPDATEEHILAYHTSCHLRAQGIGKPWLKLLQAIKGLHMIELDCGCCGMSGTYGFKQENYNISMEIGQKLFQEVIRIQPEQVLTECATCRMQIQHGTGYSARHPVEIFAQLLGC